MLKESAISFDNVMTDAAAQFYRVSWYMPRRKELEVLSFDQTMPAALNRYLSMKTGHGIGGAGAPPVIEHPWAWVLKWYFGADSVQSYPRDEDERLDGDFMTANQKRCVQYQFWEFWIRGFYDPETNIFYVRSVFELTPEDIYFRGEYK